MEMNAVELKEFSNTVFEIIENNGAKKFLEHFKWQGREFNLNNKSGIKKYLKAIYLKNYPNTVQEQAKELINMFEVYEKEYGESYKRVHVFKNQKGVMEKIHEIIDVDGDENYYDFSPTGLWFSNPAKIIKTNERVIVIQKHMLDC